jgi:DNA topoisomerase I
MARELGKDAATGKPVSVRMGRFGPFVQIGTKDDADKPRFAGLRPGQKMDNIGLSDAMALFVLPRKLGATAAGEEVTAAIGRFGPYIKYGAKYVSLKDDDPYTVTFERALDVIAAKQIVDANRIIQDFGIDKIQVLNGRYGPYVSDGAKNARIPKDREPKSLTLEECRALLAAAPAKGTRGRFGRKFAAKGTARTTPEPAGANGGTPTPAKAAKKSAGAKAGNGNAAKTKAPAKTKGKAAAKKAVAKPPAISRPGRNKAGAEPAS